MNQLLHNEKLNTGIRITAGIAIIAMLAVSVFVYGLNVLRLLAFFAFLLVYVQIPGLFICAKLKTFFEHFSTRLIVAFFTGWALIIAEYFLTELINTNVLLYAIGPVLTTLFVVDCVRSKNSSKNGNLCGQACSLCRIKFNKISAAFCIFVVLVLFYALINTQFIYLAPELSDFSYMNADKAYHMGLINSLSHGYPLESPWVQGREIHYHIFTEMLLAVALRLFGFSSDFLLMSCNAYMTTYVLCLSIYAAMREMLRRKDRAGIYSLCIMLSNIYISKDATTSLAFRFFIINDNAAGYGVAGCLVIIILLKYCGFNKEDKLGAVSQSGAALTEIIASSCTPFYILLTLILMLTTGIKGPMGAVMIAALWGTFILALIMTKVEFKKVIPLLVASAGFLLIYATVLGSKGQSNGGGESIIAFATIANICFWKPAVITFLKGFGCPKIIRLGVVFVIFFVFLLTAYFLPFVIGYIRELILVIGGKKKFDFAWVSVYAATMVGITMMFVLNYSGHSQIYFGLVGVMFATLIAYRYIEDLEESGKEGLLKTIKLVFFGTLVLTTISLCAYYVDNFSAADAHADPHHQYDYYMSVSNDEYEAMEWIEENTEDDALLATDRFYSVPLTEYTYQNRWSNRFFLYAVYSNRFCYIAGSGYNLPAGDWVIRKEMLETNSELYDPTNEERGDLARELGVDYVVVSKRFTQLPSLENEDYKKCYENDEVVIYEVDDAA